MNEVDRRSIQPHHELPPRLIIAGPSGERFIAGMTYLGGTSLFNPDAARALMSRVERNSVARAMISMSNQAISDELRVPIDTIKAQFRRVFKRLDIPSRAGIFYRLASGDTPALLVTQPIDEVYMQFAATSRRRKLVKPLARGLGAQGIADEIDGKRLTVKSSTERMGKVLGSGSRENMSSAAIMGGLTDIAPIVQDQAAALHAYYQGKPDYDDPFLITPIFAPVPELKTIAESELEALEAVAQDIFNPPHQPHPLPISEELRETLFDRPRLIGPDGRAQLGFTGSLHAAQAAKSTD